MHLRKGVHFQKASPASGREVVAADVVAGLERLRTPNDPSFVISNRFRFVDTYTAVDNSTIQIKFKQPDANFLSWMTHPGAGTVLPSESLKKYGDNFGVLEAMYGTGPFVIDPASYKPGVSVRLTRNPDYDAGPMAGLPYLDGIEMVWIADASTRAAALRTGALDIGLSPTLEVEDYRKKNYQIGSTKDRIVAAQHLAFNTQAAPTNDARVRQALHRALDREELKNVAGDGFADIPIIFGLQSAWYAPPSEWADKPGFRAKKDEDIADAKRLLSAAGIDPKSLTLRLGCSTQNAYKVHYEQAVAIKGILERNLGVKVELKPDMTTYQSAKFINDNGIHLTNVADGGVGNLILDDALQSKFQSKALQNSAFWNDAKTDQLIEKEASTLDDTERKKLFREIQTYLMDDATLPVAPTARNYDYYVAAPTVQNWVAPSYFVSNYNWQMDTVWLKT